MEENVKKDCRQLMIYEKFVHKVNTPEYMMIPFIQINNQNCRTINGWIVIIVGDKLRNVKQKTRTTLITTMSSLHSALRDMN